MEPPQWESVLKFDLDEPISEYGFSTRLENENYWTTNFAAKAIIEYKKFMYLAAVSDSMVSPSAIVDIVWHQHLIFTQSYDDFCTLLGKKITHIPSTHSKSDFAQFARARNHTEKLYRENFGTRPTEIWNYDDIYGPLNIDQSALTVEKMIGLGAGLLIPLLVVAWYGLQPLYVTIDNPYFIGGYLSITIVCIIGLEVYNKMMLKSFIKQWPQNSVVFNLAPLELVYLKSNNIANVIHGVVNRLVEEEHVSVLSDSTFSVNDLTNINNPLLLCTAQTIAANPKISYPSLLKLLELKPVFNKIVRAIDELKYYIRSSKKITKTFAISFVVFYVLFLLGATRLIIGVQREKPVTIIIAVMIAFTLAMIGYLYRLSTVTNAQITNFYREKIVTEAPAYDSWDWQYFVLGNAVFVASFLPVMAYAQNGDAGSVSSSDSGSSCGSGGGSSCGGCGAH